MHPKVRVPAIVGTVITVVLAVLSGLSGVPAAAPYVAGAMTLIQTLSGWLAYGPER